MLASNAEIDDFRARAGTITRIEWLDALGCSTTHDRADHARIVKRAFNKAIHTIRVEPREAIALAGRQCLETTGERT